MNRLDIMNQVKRIVIKIGTNTIVREDQQLNFRKLDRLAYVAATLMQEGKEVIFVSSGAIGVGAITLNVTEYPKAIPDQQALAAVGQGILMGHYNRFFRHYNIPVGQILLTRDVVDYPTSHYNVKQAMEKMIQMRIVPIINENDTVAVDELNHETKFGDNDNLSAIVAEICEADLLVIMSDVDGLYNKNPKQFSDALRLSEVSAITTDVLSMADGKGSEFSTGGMLTKLQAASRVLDNNQAMLIMSGEQPEVLIQIVEGADKGTLFINSKKE